jgi:DNA polymerase-3 subunit delta
MRAYTQIFDWKSISSGVCKVKYTSRVSFLNQVKTSVSSGFSSRIYWVGVPDDYERAEVLEALLRFLATEDRIVQRFSGSGLSLKELSSHLQSSSLFGGEPIAVVDEVEKIAKADVASLRGLFPTTFGYLILAAKSKSPLFEAAEEEGVVLDLVAEKPWEKERRIEQQLDALVKSVGKVFGSGALRSLLERLDLDAGVLEREVDKLLCYIGERPRIEIADVEKIASSSRTFTVWQTAEEWIWEGTGVTDESIFHALIPALRLQLQLGLKIASLLKENASREEWGKALPKVFPKTLEKRTVQTERMGAAYFKRGLLALFDVELRSRTGSSSYGALLDLFRAKFHVR